MSYTPAWDHHLPPWPFLSNQSLTWGTDMYREASLWAAQWRTRKQMRLYGKRSRSTTSRHRRTTVIFHIKRLNALSAKISPRFPQSMRPYWSIQENEGFSGRKLKRLLPHWARWVFHFSPTRSHNTGLLSHHKSWVNHSLLRVSRRLDTRLWCRSNPAERPDVNVLTQTVFKANGLVIRERMVECISCQPSPRCLCSLSSHHRW